MKSESAPEKVVRKILKAIKSGEIRPGEKLPNHQKMAEKYGVGMSSIREAINALAVQDRVVAIQGKGTFVKDPSPEDTESENVSVNDVLKDATVYNLMEIRQVLECHAVEKAAREITEDQIEVLQKILERLKKCYSEDHLYLTEDINFHVEIARAAKNPLLGELVKAIHLVVNQKTSVIFKTSSTENIKKAIASASDVVNFIISGDGSRAKRCMREHLGITKDVMLKTLFDESDL